MGLHARRSRGVPVHSHGSRSVPHSERDAIPIANQLALIRQLEWRVRAQQEWIQVLETLVGYEKLGLKAEIENLRRALRSRTT